MSNMPRIYKKQWYLSNLIDRYEFESDIDVENIKFDSSLIETFLLNLIDSSNSISIYAIEDYDKSKLFLIGEKDAYIMHNLFSFIELDAFALEGLVFLEDLNGKRFSDLDGRYKRRINDSIINLNFFLKNEVNESDKEKLKKLLK